MLMTGGFWIALNVLLISLTSLYVTVTRGKTGIPHDDAGNETMARARRAHLTAMEFSVPYFAALIVYDRLAGADAWILWTGLAFLLGRLLHVTYMYGFSGFHLLRGLGATISHAASIILAVLILMRVA